MGERLLDPLLGAAIIWLAWRALHDRDLFRGVILFIAFGLLMALMWARLGAPDIALAEAAIGAGLSGALLISAVTRLGADADRADDASRSHGAVGKTIAAVAAMGVAGVGYLAAIGLHPAAAELPALIHANLERSEVAHPVTAVLLNFRAYDTWLEVVVLLTALIAVQALAGARARSPRARRTNEDQVLSGVVRLLLPMMVLVGGYFLWRGTHAPGGAFQAGAVLGSAGLLAVLGARRYFDIARSATLRFAAAVGALAFLLAAAESALSRRHFLELAPGMAGFSILLLELAVTISIALTLAGLFVDSTGHKGEAVPNNGAEREVRR
jgi:multisubunit Na+/H+ antiporter MnhB subunit